MPGLDESLFYDLTTREKNNLTCCICYCIYKDPLASVCGHPFCKECVEQWIKGKRNNCPKCMVKFTRKRSEEIPAIIGGFVFKPDFTAKGFVDELIAKCIFKPNGCHERVIFGTMDSHLKRCEHRPCSDCGFKMGKSEEHNCLELMKKDRDHLRSELNDLRRESDNFKKETDRVNTEYNLFKNKTDQFKREQKSELDHIKNKCDLLQLEKDGFNIELESHKRSIELYQKEEKQLKNEIEQKKNKSKNAKKLMKELTEQNLNMEKRMKIFKVTCEEWKTKCNDLIMESNSIEDHISKGKRLEGLLEHSLENTGNLHKEISNLVKDVGVLEKVARFFVHCQSISLNTRKYQVNFLEMTSDAIKLYQKNSGKNTRDMVFPFNEFEEITYCSDQSYSALFIRPNIKFIHRLQKSLKIDSRFNDPQMNNQVSNDYNIIIELKSDLSADVHGTLTKYLTYISNKNEYKIKFRAIDLIQYKQMIENCPCLKETHVGAINQANN